MNGVLEKSKSTYVYAMLFFIVLVFLLCMLYILFLDEPDHFNIQIPNQEKTLILGGGGSKFWYYAGQIQSRIDKHPEYIDSFEKIVGISAGSLLGIFTCSKCDLRIIRQKSIELVVSMKTKPTTIFKCLEILREFCENNLPENAYVLCSNKLHIQTIHIYSCTSVCFHTFSSNADLIDKFMKAAHIPLLCSSMTNDGYIDRCADIGKSGCCDSTNIEKIVCPDFNLFDIIRVPDEAFIETQFDLGLGLNTSM